MKDGKIRAVDMKLYNNGGYSLDLSVAVSIEEKLDGQWGNGSGPIYTNSGHLAPNSKARSRTIYRYS